jgi:hypothetical protein
MCLGRKIDRNICLFRKIAENRDHNANPEINLKKKLIWYFFRFFDKFYLIKCAPAGIWAANLYVCSCTYVLATTYSTIELTNFFIIDPKVELSGLRRPRPPPRTGVWADRRVVGRLAHETDALLPPFRPKSFRINFYPQVLGPMLWFFKIFSPKNWRFWLKIKLDYPKFWS